MEAARDRAEEALKLEMEAVTRWKEDPTAIDECLAAKATARRADAEYEWARRTYLDAARFGGADRPGR